MKARLYALLIALCPRVYIQGMVPAGAGRPYVTYFPIAGRSINYIDNAVPDAINSAMQISVWADRQSDADTLNRQIEDAIRTATALQGRPMAAPIDTYESDTKLCGSIQRFDIWASR